VFLLRGTSFEARKSFGLACFLTLVAAWLQSDADVGSGRVDRTGVVCSEELALVSCGDDKALALLLKIRHQSLVGHTSGAFTDVSSGEVWFTENVQVVGFDDQMAFAAGAAFIALVHTQKKDEDVITSATIMGNTFMA